MNVKHKFSVGQSVYFATHSGNRGQTSSAGTYKIVRQLPIEADQVRYRIKGAHENFERTAEEYELTRSA